MLFNSFQFLIFFSVVATIYFLLPHNWRWIWLLTASCYFYMAFIPVYIVILFVTILIDYFAAILIEDAVDHRTKKRYLLLSVLSTCAVLFIFKYFNFFNTNVAALARFLHWNYPVGSLSLLLPIGLSFHTFQSLSYVVEVYRGRYKAERHFGIYALYVMFFPQLVAGPIERPQNLLHQFFMRHEFNYDRITSGLKLMLWGFFKKVVIADRLAVFVNELYSHPADFHGRIIVWITYCFAIQIYCDFSGYSDIARGSARVLGFELMKNFKSPYLARNVADFWRRWHIALSTWFRDYVYFPLGGNRVSKPVWFRNLMAVFLISGLWHGANWTYVVWGALHGFYMWMSHVTSSVREAAAGLLWSGRLAWVRRIVQTFVTFQLVALAWIFFRANSIGDALTLIRHIFSPGTSKSLDYVTGFTAEEKLFILACVMAMELVQSHKTTVMQTLAKTPQPLRWIFYYSFILFILFCGTYTSQQFIYFQF